VANSLGVLEYARQNPESMVLLLEVVDQVRAFRLTHWIFTKIHIIQKSTHPVGSGGSPITTWLSNQLLTTIKYIKDNCKYAISDELPSYMLSSLNSILIRADSDETVIKRETENLRKIFKQ